MHQEGQAGLAWSLQIRGVMSVGRVVEWVDVNAPREEVFGILVDLKKRLQLSPLWGLARVEHVSEDYPAEGSTYQVRMQKDPTISYETVITALQPLRKLSYDVQVAQNTQVSWMLQERTGGTRIIYQEEFQVDDTEDGEFAQKVREIVRDWLRNIKNYSELRGSRARRLLRLVIDRYFLNLRTDQRRTVVLILFMHAVGFISFVMAALALGAASLLGSI